MKSLITHLGFAVIGLAAWGLQSCTPAPSTPTIIANNSPVCVGGTISITANSSTSGVTYYWSGPGGFTATGATITIPAATPANAGTYSVYVNNSNGNSATTTATVTVNPLVTPAISITTPNTIICGGISVTFTATPTNGGTVPVYQWKKNGLNVGTNSSSYIDATLVDGDQIACVLTSNASCTSPSNTTTSNTIVMTVTPGPIINIALSGPTTFCAGGNVTLTVSGTGTDHVWKNGTTTVQIGGTFYTATESGSYTVTASLATCSITSLPTIVTMVPIPSATITPSGPLVFCQGENVVLSAPTGAGYTYKWMKDGDSIANTSSYTATQSGSYTVKVTAQGLCAATSVPSLVEVHPLPPATISSIGPLNICAGENVVLIANPGYDYQWRNGAGDIPGATAMSYTATISGNYSVVVRDGLCTQFSNTLTVSVTPLPIPVITPAGPTTVCAGESVILNANTGTGYVYNWKRNDTLVGTGSSYTATQSGHYTLKITDANCSGESLEITVSVLPTPLALISVLGDTVFCSGDEVILAAPQGMGYTYQWIKDGIDIAGATLATLHVVQGGSYQVAVSTANAAACQALSSTKNITVFPVPVVPIMMTNNTFNTYDFYTSYQWYLNGNPISGANSYVYQPVQNGTYKVSVVDANGCSNTSPDRDFISNGIGTVSLDGITIYPNPASDQIGIDALIPVNIKLLSTDGKIVLEQSKVQVVNIAQLADGVYLLRITDAHNNLLKVERVVKRSR
jgi:hypothetical protein